MAREHVRRVHVPPETCPEKHVWGGPCYTCDLFICSVCNCAEGTLTTDCAGVVVDEETQQRVYTQGEDFIGGVWVNAAVKKIIIERRKILNLIGGHRGTER